MSAAQQQAPALLPLKKGVVKQVSRKILKTTIFGYFHLMPTQQLRILTEHVFPERPKNGFSKPNLRLSRALLT
jgi:hypothetical protein